MKMTVDFKGGQALEAALAELSTQATRRNVAIRALEQAGAPMRDRAKALAPVDVHDLEKSIEIAPRAVRGSGTRTKRGGNAGGFGDVVEVFLGIDTAANPAVNIYGPMSEFGLGHMPLQPFFRPAFDDEKHATLDRIRQSLTVEIGKAAARQERRAAKLAAKARA